MDNSYYNERKTNKELYRCLECGLHYKEKAWRDKCEAWCKERHSCNLEIIIHAIENERS